MEPEIIYSDEDFVVINKPPGIPVHGGLTIEEKTVVDFLLKKFPEIKGVGDLPAPDRASTHAGGQAGDSIRPGIVHRLDKNTSGVMIVARNQKTFLALKELFQKHLVEKKYLAICCGEFKEKRGIINMPIGRIIANPLKRGVNPPTGGGKSRIRGEREAVTGFRVVKTGEALSLVELEPKTGRMHQIRVHLAALHHPVACDTVYGGKNVCCPRGASRQLLHASSISFSYPEGRKLIFEAEAPSDFAIAEASIL